MRPGPFRSAALGFLIGAVALFPLAGCTCTNLENVTEEVVVKCIQINYNEWETKRPKDVVMKLGERLCWKVRWDRVRIEIDWKPGQLAVPFAIRCAGDECWSDGPATVKGTFHYRIRAWFDDRELPVLDPDVIVEGSI
jgi:hypothetical protein